MANIFKGLMKPRFLVTIIGICGILGATYFFILKLANIFAFNDTTQVWTFNSSNAGSYTYNESLITVDDLGARPASNTNKVVNPSFDSNNTNWSVSVIAPSGWSEVPGDNDTYGLDNFLVMKYEAKAWDTQSDAVVSLGGAYASDNWSGSNAQTRYVARSIPQGLPWVKIPQSDATNFDANEACQAIGSGYHLISNAEWMNIVRNAEANPANWSGGSLGNGYLFIGHTDNSPGLALPASTTDTGNYSCAYTDAAGTVEAPSACPTYTANNTGYNEGNQKRVLELSNGSYVWDMAGNVWE